MLIHEIFGMSDWVEDLADQVAAAGYIAVAPDLLSGMGPNGGRTSDVCPGQSDGSGGPTQSRPGHRRSQRRRRLRQQNSCVQRQVVCGGFCWGGGQTFRFATNRSDLSGGICVLRRRLPKGCHGSDQGSGVRILCRQRCANRRHASRYDGADESGRQDIRASSRTRAPDTASCAPAKRPMPTMPTRRPARMPGCAGRICWENSFPRRLLASIRSPPTVLPPVAHDWTWGQPPPGCPAERSSAIWSMTGTLPFDTAAPPVLSLAWEV